MERSVEIRGQQSHSTSLSLLRRVRCNDTLAWDRFTRLYGPLVYNWSRRTGLQDSDSADVTQEVFAALAEQLDRFNPQRDGATFRGWLWGVVRNKLREHWRQGVKEPIGSGGTNVIQRLPIPDDEPSPSEVTDALAKRALDLIRTDFSEQTWEIFWRVQMVGDSARKIAGELGVSVASVYAAKSRVLKHLRAELEGLLD